MNAPVGSLKFSVMGLGLDDLVMLGRLSLGDVNLRRWYLVYIEWSVKSVLI